MAFMIKGIIDLKGILFLMLLAVTSQATNLDCYGKAFHCVNSTHFMICVDLGRGISTTIDDIIIPCPSPTVCRRSNRFECEFPLPFVSSSTVATTELATTATTESEVTTFAALATIYIPFEEYLNTVSTTTQSQTVSQQPPADTLLPVNPITGGLDTSNFSTTEKAFTGKSISSDVNVTRTVIDSNLSSNNSNINALGVGSNAISNFNVILNDTVSANNSQNITQAQITGSSKLNAESSILGYSTSNNASSTGSVKEGNTQNVFIESFGLTINMTEAVTIGAVTEVAENNSSADFSNTLTKQTVTTEQYFTSFQDVPNASKIDIFSTLFDTTESLAPTQDVKQINESLSVKNTTKNSAGDFNTLNEIFVNVSSVDVMGASPEQTVNIKPDLALNLQEVTLNTTITDYLAELAKETSQNDKPLNASKPVKDIIKHVTDSFGDVFMAQESTSNSISTVNSTMIYTDTNVTESPVLNITESFPADETELLLNATEISFISTEENTFSTVTNTITENTIHITYEQVSTQTLPNTLLTGELPHGDIMNVSKSKNSTIDSGSLSHIETNAVIGENKTNIIKKYSESRSESRSTESPAGSTTERIAIATLATTEINSVLGIADKRNPDQITNSPAHIVNDSPSVTVYIVKTEPIKEENKISDEWISGNVKLLNNTSTNDPELVMENKTRDIFNMSTNQNYFGNDNQNGTFFIRVNQKPDMFSPTRATVVTETQFTSNSISVHNLADVDAGTGTSIIEDPLKNPFDNLTSSTIELYPVTEILTTVLLNDINTFTNTRTETPTSSVITETVIVDPQSDVENIGFNIDTLVRNTTDRLIQNEKVLSTNYSDNTASTQAYKSSKIENSTLDGIANKPTTNMLGLLLKEEKAKIKLPTDTVKFSGLNIAGKSGNVSSTDSTILSTESVISKHAFNDSSIIHTKDTIKIKCNISTVLDDNGSVALINGQTQPTMDSLLTPVLNTTDTLNIYNVSTDVERNKNSTHQYVDNITSIENTILSAHVTIVDKYKTQSSELIKTFPHSDNIEIDTSSSLPSTTMEVTEAAYVSSLPETFAEKENHFDDTTIFNSNNEPETQIKTVLIQKNNNSEIVFHKNINETPLKAAVLINNKENTDSIKDTILKVPQSYTRIKQSTTDNNTNSEIYYTTNPTLKKMTSDVFRNNLSNTEKKLSDNTISNQNHTTQNIKTTELPSELLGTAYNFSTNVRVQSTTETSLTATTDNSITNKNYLNESTILVFVTENFLETTNNTLPIISEVTEKEQNPNAQSGLEIHSHKFRDYEAGTADTNIEITRDMPGIKNTTNHNMPSEKGKIPIMTTNLMDNVTFNLLSMSYLATKSHKTITTPTYFNTVPTNENIPGTSLEIPVIENIDNRQNLTVKEGDINKKQIHVTAINKEQQTNVMDNVMFNSSSLGASNQEPLLSITHTDLHVPAVTPEERNEVSSKSVASLISDEGIQTTSFFNNVAEYSHASTTEITFNSELGPGLFDSALNKEEDTQHLIEDARDTTTSRPSLVLTVTSPIETTTLYRNEYLNAQINKSVQRQTSNTISVSQFVTKSTGNEVPSLVGTTQTLLNHNRDMINKDILSSADLLLPVITIEEGNEFSSTSATSPLSDKNTEITSAVSNVTESSHTSVAEITFTNSELGPGLFNSALNKEENTQHLTKDARATTTTSRPSLVFPVTSPIETTTFHKNGYQDAQINESLPPETSSTISVGRFITKSSGELVPTVAGSTQTLLNNNTSKKYIILSADLLLSVVTIGERNEVSSTSAPSLISDQSIRTIPISNVVKPSLNSTTEVKFNSELGIGMTNSTLNKEDTQHLINDSRAPMNSKQSLVLTVTSPIETTTLYKNQNLNAEINESLLTQTSNTISVSQFVTNSTEKIVSTEAGTTQTLLNQNRDTTNKDIISSADYGLLSVTLPVTAKPNLFLTKPILTSETLPTDADTSRKPQVTTVSGDINDVIKAANTRPLNGIDQSTVSDILVVSEPLGQSEITESSMNSPQVSQINFRHVDISAPSTTFTSFDINRQMSIKVTENIDHVTNIDPTTGPTKRDLVIADDSQMLTGNMNTKINGIIYAVDAFTTGQLTETLKRETNTNIKIIDSNTDRVKSPEIMKKPTIPITASSVPNITSIENNVKSISPLPRPSMSSDFGVPIEVATSDVLVDSKIKSEKTHSGIISIITKALTTRESKEKKEEPETKETEKGEKQEHPINVELASLQDKSLFTPSTDIPVTSVNENGVKVQRDISTREELLLNEENNNYSTITQNSKHLSTKMDTIKNIHYGTNTTVSGYKKETPTREPNGNSTTSINNSHISNNTSQDQNLDIPQTHNKSVISNDQSSTSRYMSQSKSTAAPDTQTTGFPPIESTTRKTNANNSFCKQKKRGRYADEFDCRKFYICLGNKSSHVVEGICPVNTVFSEINKQCTKNLSHCIRNNQFRCVNEGRYSDFLYDNIYYICIRNNLSQFIRFKLQCQNGYHLNKTFVRCVLNNELTSTTDSKSASEQSSSSKNQETIDKPEKKFKCKREGVFPDPSNCKIYFECTKVDSSYRQKKKKCDSDEIFHKDKKKCVDSDSNEC